MQLRFCSILMKLFYFRLYGEIIKLYETPCHDCDDYVSDDAIFTAVISIFLMIFFFKMMTLLEYHAINMISYDYCKVLTFQHNFATLAVISTLLNDFMLVEN